MCALLAVIHVGYVVWLGSDAFVSYDLQIHILMKILPAIHIHSDGQAFVQYYVRIEVREIKIKHRLACRHLAALRSFLAVGNTDDAQQHQY